MTKKIRIGISDSTSTAREFIDAWKRAERGEKVETQERLNFENIETLLKALTPGRWVLLKTLRANRPMSIRALAKALTRDYKNVHKDVQRLKSIGLIGRTQDNKIEVPWDIIEAQLRLAA